MTHHFLDFYFLVSFFAQCVVLLLGQWVCLKGLKQVFRSLLEREGNVKVGKTHTKFDPRRRGVSLPLCSKQAPLYYYDFPRVIVLQCFTLYEKIRKMVNQTFTLGIFRIKWFSYLDEHVIMWFPLIYLRAWMKYECFALKCRLTSTDKVIQHVLANQNL